MLFSDVKQKFCHNYHVQYRAASNKMDDDINDSSLDFLSDLNNEKTSEQLLFDSKVIMQTNNLLELELTS